MAKFGGGGGFAFVIVREECQVDVGLEVIKRDTMIHLRDAGLVGIPGSCTGWWHPI